jgi:hypothetical protein
VTVVKLKTCEACGTLHYRPESEANPYCRSCTELLKDFPTVESRKRRGRPATKHLKHNIALEGITIRMEVDG